MSLSRLWQCQGNWEAAHKLLAPIYGWFTEGVDTADFQEAKALETTRIHRVAGPYQRAHGYRDAGA